MIGYLIGGAILIALIGLVVGAALGRGARADAETKDTYAEYLKSLEAKR